MNKLKVDKSRLMDSVAHLHQKSHWYLAAKSINKSYTSYYRFYEGVKKALDKTVFGNETTQRLVDELPELDKPNILHFNLHELLTFPVVGFRLPYFFFYIFIVLCIITIPISVPFLVVHYIVVEKDKKKIAEIERITSHLVLAISKD